MDTNKLLRGRIPKNKDPHTILVNTWYCKLGTVPSVLKINLHLISSDPKLPNCYLPKKQVPFRSPVEKRY